MGKEIGPLEIEKRFGVSTKRTLYLSSRGYIIGQGRAVGQGRARKYSEPQVLEVVFFDACMKAGLSCEEAYALGFLLMGEGVGNKVKTRLQIRIADGEITVFVFNEKNNNWTVLSHGSARCERLKNYLSPNSPKFNEVYQLNRYTYMAVINLKEIYRRVYGFFRGE